MEFVVTSDLRRARETATAIAAAHGLAPEADPRWREFSFGAWEGLTWTEICARDPALRSAPWTSYTHYAAPGGEDFEALRARVAPAVEELRRRGAACGALVAHAGSIHALLHCVLGSDDPHLIVPLDPGGITRLTMDETTAEITSLNDLSHFD